MAEPTYAFGIGAGEAPPGGGQAPNTVDGMAIESISAEDTHQYIAEAKNVEGVIDAIKIGASTGTCSVSGYLKGTLPVLGDTLSIESRSFIVDKVTTTKTNTDFQKCEITGKFWAGISG